MAYVPTGVTVDQLQTFADRLQAALHAAAHPSLSQVKEAFARAAGYAHAHDAHQAAQRADQGLPQWSQVSARRLAEWAAPFRRQWMTQASPSALAVLAHQWGHPHVKALLMALATEPKAPSLRARLKAQGLETDQITAIQQMLHQPVGLVLLASRERPVQDPLMKALLEALTARLHHKAYAVATTEDIAPFQDQPITMLNAPPEPALDPQEQHLQLIKAAMRADPDVLLIGEVRDAFTTDCVRMVSQAGHKAISSIRATSVSDVLVQLKSFGLSTQQLASRDLLSGVIYHETFPCLCPTCAVPFTTTLGNPGIADPQSQSRPERRLVEVLTAVNVPLDQIKGRGPGCDACRHTGLMGALECTEMFSMAAVRRALRSSSPQGVPPPDDGAIFRARVIERIRQGVISPWDAMETLTQMKKHPPLSVIEVTGEPARLPPSLAHLHVEAPTGHPPFVWTEAQKEELMGAFREMAALEERMNTASEPDPLEPKPRPRSPR